MNGSNHNPGVTPGRYNPQSQTKTEANDYLASIYPGYFDPTQVPMNPMDTQVPMDESRRIESSDEGQRLSRTQQPPSTHPEVSEQYRIAVEAQYQQQKVNRIQAVIVPITIELTINLKVNQTNG